MDIGEMLAGNEIDALVAEHVMGWLVNRRDGGHWQVQLSPGRWDCLHNHPFSTSFAATKLVIDKLAPLVGNFAAGDGFFILMYSADYDGRDVADCTPVGEDLEHGNYWTAHFHLGLIGANGGCPKHWDHGDMFCATAETLELAVCRAAVLAMIPHSKESDHA